MSDFFFKICILYGAFYVPILDLLFTLHIYWRYFANIVKKKYAGDKKGVNNN